MNSAFKLPGLWNIKDIHSTYVSFSDDFAKLLGWQSAEECLGKTDYDIPCNAVQFADEFIKMDQKIIGSGEKMVALDIQEYALGWKLIIAEKNPIKNTENKITGLYNPCIDVSDVNIFRAHFLLHQFDNKYAGKTIKPASYILTDSYSPLPLTEKQQNCLFLLIRGKSWKEIARILKISPRTVECHLDAIKLKLNCKCKTEIIEKAIDGGFLYYIPKHLQNNKFEQLVKEI